MNVIRLAFVATLLGVNGSELKQPLAIELLALLERLEQLLPIFISDTGPVSPTPRRAISSSSIFLATPMFSVREAVEPAYILGRY
ncbi:hypothetical protein SAMN05216299_1112 [Nitrosospira sp. Nsp14]|nr:hypothetical protein SAMN05216299_1112 [Nitrosospira sp. Nsp14]